MATTNRTTELSPPDELGPLLEYLKDERAFDFTGYKRPTLNRRIRKRMHSLGIETVASYHRYLEAHPEAFYPLFNAVLINVTAFFRDPETWEFLSTQVLPELLGRKGPGDPVRVWSAGCASGEEAYSIAMALTELIGAEDFVNRV